MRDSFVTTIVSMFISQSLNCPFALGGEPCGDRDIDIPRNPKHWHAGFRGISLYNI